MILLLTDVKYKYGDFYTKSTLYIYSIRGVVMYTCHLAWWSGAIQRMLFSNIHWKVLLFTPRSMKRLETSKHPVNGDSDIFLFESIEGWSTKQDKTSEQTVRSSDKSVYDRSRSILYIPRGERDVIRLRNPTEDSRAFRRMLTSADLNSETVNRS